MNRPLRVLILEDNPSDAAIVKHTLKKAGFVYEAVRVQAEADYLSELEKLPDLILADYSLPGFDAPTALKLRNARQLDIPFIVITGTVGEEPAVACMREGASDYLLKDRLVRLGEAVKHALQTKRLRDENRLQRQQIESLLENAPDIVMRFGRDHRYLYINSTVERLMGVPREAYIGKTNREIGMPEEQVLQWEAVLEQAFTSGQEASLEFSYPTLGGLRHFQARSMPERDESGAVQTQLVITRDITERKRSEEALRLSEARLHFLLSATTAMIYSNEPRYPYRTTFASDNVRDILGYAPQDFLNDSEFWLTRVHPDDLQRVMAEPGSHYEQGQLAQEYRFLHADGSYRWMREDSRLVCDAAGKPVEIVGYWFDITDRKEIELSLAESLTRFELATRATSDLIYDLNLETHEVVLSGDTKNAFGYASLPSHAHDWWPINKHPDDWAGPEAFMQQLMTTEEDLVQNEYRFKCADGSYAHVLDRGLLVRNTQGKPVKMIGAMSDISELVGARQAAERHAEELRVLNLELEKRLAKLASTNRIDQAITSSLDLNLILDVILQECFSQLEVDAASILIYKPHTHTLAYEAGKGFRTGALQRIRPRLGDGPAGEAALMRRVVSVADLSNTASSSLGALRAEEFVSCTAVPLLAAGRVQGVLELYHRRTFTPGSDWLSFAQALGLQAAIAIRNITLFHDLQRSNLELGLAYDTTIEGWSRALDLRDEETEGHSQRVTELSVQLARQLGVADNDLVHLRRGALLHDIGKMGVPDGILLKPGKLDAREWELMKRHTTYGYEMLLPISFLKPALDIPYAHHEKWDGTGYPRGLKGEEIPLAARIFAVVDVYDALTSNRPYRDAWPKEQALHYIEEQSGTHFDPMVVRAFLESVGAQLHVNA